MLSILFYKSETWVTTKVMKKEIDFFGTSCYRYMLGKRRIDRVRNEEVLQRVQRSNLSNLMYKRQLRSLGHWIRKDDIIRRFALYKTAMEEIDEEDQGWTTTSAFKISPTNNKQLLREHCCNLSSSSSTVFTLSWSLDTCLRKEFITSSFRFNSSWNSSKTLFKKSADFARPQTTI